MHGQFSETALSGKGKRETMYTIHYHQKKLHADFWRWTRGEVHFCSSPLSTLNPFM
jgi:hypothetical protein